MTEQETQALKQVLAWVRRLELNGQSLNDSRYFRLAGDIESVFGGVALLHGLTAQQVRELADSSKNSG